jgi:presenilin-like A22 family membrane protease
MKHELKVTFFLLILFLAAQAVGLFLLNQSIETVEITDEGDFEVIYSEPVTGRPDIEEEGSFLYIFIMILVGTALLLLLIKFRLFKIWKAWFFLAVWGALLIAFSVLVSDTVAAVLALILAYLKIFRPNFFVHNATEIFMYGGIAILISPLFNVFWAVMLLLAISVYDALAVWKLKHMITLATAQAEEKMFAGLLIPYSRKRPEHESEIRVHSAKHKTESKLRTDIKVKIPKGFKDEEIKSAILGGGDIAFPLLFAGAVMTGLIQQGTPQNIAFFQAFIVSLFAGIALFILLIKSQKDKFYPAMPFITAGCMVGYGVVLLI